MLFNMTTMNAQGVIVLLLLVGTASACWMPKPRSSCPRDWFPGEFSIMVDTVRNSPDEFLPPLGFGFFTDIMMYSQEQIEDATERAMAFFNQRYGLDFSSLEPNELGFRIFENATFYPYTNDDVGFTGNFNTWIKNGVKRSTCYPIRDGGFLVSVASDSQQTLHGTYGGVNRVPLSRGEFIAWAFYNIQMEPYQPNIIINYKSNTPIRTEPVDGTTIFNLDLYHEELRTGRALDALRVTPTDDPGYFQYSYRSTITFPANAANP